MIKAILFDLDDTLLGNATDSFMAGYFGLLSDYARPIMDSEQFIKRLKSATQSTIRNTDPELTNADVFWMNFLDSTELNRAELESFFVTFYEDRFSLLQSRTRVIPTAEQIVRQSLDQGLMVVVATNPLFPRTAIEQRLEWAGVPVSAYDYALVTCYENMHAAKPNPAYYQEILNMIGVRPEEALMVGDNWVNDIVAAGSIGAFTYWIADPEAPRPDETPTQGQGSLNDLHHLMTQGWLEELAVLSPIAPTFKPQS